MAGIIDEMTAAQARSLRLALREAVIHEIMTVRKVIDAYDSGTTDKSQVYHLQVPYVEEAANLLTNPQGNLELKVCSSTQTGIDKTQERNISLNQQQQDEGNDSQEAKLAQLVMYFLQTRGKLTQVQKKQNVLDIHADLQFCEPHENRRGKKLYLQNPDLLQARRVHSLGCGSDPEWSLRVLQVLAPRIEDIHLTHIGLEHLLVLETMPRLRRLRIWSVDDAVSCNDFGPFRWRDAGESLVNDPADSTVAWHLDKLPESNDGLVWLKIDAPRQVTLPLIAQHRRTLRELVLHAGLPNDDLEEDSWQRQWSWYSNDLPEALQMLVQRHPMDALRLVELWRLNGACHYWEVDLRKCAEQLRALRKVFGPKVEVRCSRCG